MADFIERAKFSCALGGALTTIAGIPKVMPIVHAAGGCAAALSGTYNLAAGYRGIGYCGGTMIPTSNISENNIVVGTAIERGIAEKMGTGFLAVAFPVSNMVVLSKGYAGFSGGLTLVEDLISLLVSARCQKSL